MNTDALGNSIEIGKLYGQSSRVSGSCVILVGKAKAVENGIVKLEEVRRGMAFSEEISSTKVKRKTVSINSNTVFPIVKKVSWGLENKNE